MMDTTLLVSNLAMVQFGAGSCFLRMSISAGNVGCSRSEDPIEFTLLVVAGGTLCPEYNMYVPS